MNERISSLIIGFDFDDVLGDFWETATPIFNKKYGVQANKNDFVKFNALTEIYGIEYPEFFKTVIEEGILESIKPYPGVSDVMNKIHAQGHRIILVTSRDYHPDAELVTEMSLDKNSIPYDELHIKESGKTKADYLPDNVDFFLDDLPDNLYAIGESNKVRNLALITQPWNTGNRDFKRYSSLVHFYKEHCSPAKTLSLEI